MKKVDPKRHVAICHYCERRMWCSSEYERHEFWTTLTLMGWKTMGLVAACPDHAHALGASTLRITLPAVSLKRAMIGGVRED